MENRHRDALRRTAQAERNLIGEQVAFHRVKTFGGAEIIHPTWDRSWAIPSESTIDDLIELRFFRSAGPASNSTRGFELTMAGREAAMAIEAEFTVPAPEARAPEPGPPPPEQVRTPQIGVPVTTSGRSVHAGDPTANWTAEDQAPTAVILWAHGDPAWTPDQAHQWSGTVLAFASLLRRLGIDADLDLFHSSDPTDWSRFGPKAVRESDFVLVAVTAMWRRAWDGDLGSSESAGAAGETNELRGLFQADREEFLRRVIPVLLPGVPNEAMPSDLRATAHWSRVASLDDDGIEDLYRRLTGQPAYPKPPLGKRRVLSPRFPVAGHDGVAGEVRATEDALASLPADPVVGSAEAGAREDLTRRRAELRAELEAIGDPPIAQPAPDPPSLEPMSGGDGDRFVLRKDRGPLECQLTNTGGAVAHLETATLRTPLGEFDAYTSTDDAAPQPPPMTTAILIPGGTVVLAFGDGELEQLNRISEPLELRVRYRASDTHTRYEYRLRLLRNGADVMSRPRWRGRDPRTLVVA